MSDTEGQRASDHDDSGQRTRSGDFGQTPASSGWFVFRDAIIIGATQAIVLILVVMIAVALSGNQQARLLTDVRSAARAQVCVLLLPVHDLGRDEASTNSRCLVPNGLAPVDANGDGRVEYETPREGENP